MFSFNPSQYLTKWSFWLHFLCLFFLELSKISKVEKTFFLRKLAESWRVKSLLVLQRINHKLDIKYIYKKTFELSNMRFQALKSHADGKKHKEVVAAVSVFFKKSTKSQNTSSENSQRNASGSTQQQMLEWTVNKSQVSIVEIRWALQTVTKGHSKNLNNITELFKVIFPDSWLAKMFTLGADKTRYIIIHDIAPMLI